MLVDYLRVFITGGVICALVQLLMEKTKMMPGRIMEGRTVRDTGRRLPRGRLDAAESEREAG